MEEAALWTWAITVCYLAVLLVALVQVSRILLARHNLRSFHFAFLLLCAFWMAFRIAFFGVSVRWPVVVSMLVFWLPVDIQFATFALLVVYFGFLLSGTGGWESNRRVYQLLYGLLMICEILMTSFFISFGCTEHHADGHTGCTFSRDLERYHHIYLGLQFCALAVVFGVFGVRLHRRRRATAALSQSSLTAAAAAVTSAGLTSPPRVSAFTGLPERSRRISGGDRAGGAAGLGVAVDQHQLEAAAADRHRLGTEEDVLERGHVQSFGALPRTLELASILSVPPRSVIVISYVLTFIFLFRAGFNIGGAVDWVHLNIGGDRGGQKHLTFASFLLLVAWEVVPTSLLLWHFRHIPSTNFGGRLTFRRLLTCIFCCGCCRHAREPASLSGHHRRVRNSGHFKGTSKDLRRQLLAGEGLHAKDGGEFSSPSSDYSAAGSSAFGESPRWPGNQHFDTHNPLYASLDSPALTAGKGRLAYDPFAKDDKFNM